MTDYLVDTNILIDYMKRPETVDRYFRALRSGTDTAAFSTITEAELWEGVRNPLEARALREVLRELVRIPVGQRIARVAGQLRRRYAHDERDRVRDDWLPMPDTLIAATAVVTRRRVLTRDPHFAHIDPSLVEIVPP